MPDECPPATALCFIGTAEGIIAVTTVPLLSDWISNFPPSSATLSRILLRVPGDWWSAQQQYLRDSGHFVRIAASAGSPWGGHRPKLVIARLAPLSGFAALVSVRGRPPKLFKGYSSVASNPVDLGYLSEIDKVITGNSSTDDLTLNCQ